MNHSEISDGWFELRVAADPNTQDQLLVKGLSRSVLGLRRFFFRERIDTISLLRVWTHGVEGVRELASSLRRAALESGAAAEVTVVPHASLNLPMGPYGGPESTTLLAEMLADASSLLLDQIAKVVSGKARTTNVALDIMTAHLPAVDITRIFPERYPVAHRSSPYPGSFPMYRSHADGFLIMSKNPKAARARLDAEYERLCGLIIARVRSVLGQFNGGPVVSEAGGHWFRIARTFLHRAEASVRQGGLTVEWGDGYLGDTNDISISEFHQIAQSAREVRDFFRTDSGFLAARFMMSGLYLTLSSLGLRLVDRYFLCHAIAQACEGLFGVKATTILKNISQAVGAQYALEVSPEL
jgi:hypothetical protein